MKMKKRTLILIGVSLLLLSGAVCADVLKQQITWAPETLSLPSLKPGESTTTSVVLTNTSLLANQKIQGEHLSFQTTSGAGTLLTATANFPKQIVPGQKVAVTLVISVASSTPALPPRVIAGKVQLVENDEDGAKLFEKPLSVSITVSPFLLPPAPDKALDEATVQGIDSNANGVRDRTERYIGFTYPDSAKLRMGLMQDARVSEAILRDSGDKVATRSHAQDEHDALDCLTYLLNDDLDVIDKITGELTANFALDTALRIRADHNANAQFGGMVSGGDYLPLNERKIRCSFDPDQLPN